MTKTDVGGFLAALRKAKGYTQKQVADMLSMAQQQYSRYENGVYEINYDLMLRLCKIFDITPNDLFDIQ